MITHPTSAALARPPRRIEETTLGLTRLVGKPTMFSAVNGRPPIAKISESELAAAIWPYENGSSTIGVKKSTVWTSARWRSRRYTPASSNVFELTSTWRSNEIGSCGKTCRRACWLNLEAHPAQDESEVSFRTCSRDMRITSFLRGAVAAALCRRESPSPIWASTQRGGYRNLAERIGIEPISVPGMRNRQRF